MRHLFLIQTHKDPDQLARLARVLRKGDPNSIVLVSHNVNAAPLPPSCFAGDTGIYVIRGRGGRGDFEILDGYLGALRWLRDNKIEYDWLTNLSGQDYPVASLSEFSRELSQSSHDGFLHHFDVLRQDAHEMSPMEWPARHGFDRYYYQYTTVKQALSIAERAALRIPCIATRRLTDRLRMYTAFGLTVGRLAVQTPFTAEFRCYAGSYWHTIRRRCTDYLLEFSESEPAVVEYFRRVLIPDESFVHTVLANHRAFRFVNDNRRYYDMRGSRRGHPKLLTDGDIPRIAGRQYVFARKFEWTNGPALFDRLDRYALDDVRQALAEPAHR
jgi:hypothetical protein